MGIVERMNGTIKNSTINLKGTVVLLNWGKDLNKFLLFYNFNRRHGSLRKELKVDLMKIATFLFFSGLLTLVLLLDDLFMFHEDIFPKYLHISQNLVYVGYFSLIPIYLIKFRSMIFQTEYIVLFLALGFFGLSVICDLILPLTNIEYLIEDGFKLFGIITWFIFFIRTSFTQIQKTIES